MLFIMSTSADKLKTIVAQHYKFINEGEKVPLRGRCGYDS